jgi:hypothetical protein
VRGVWGRGRDMKRLRNGETEGHKDGEKDESLEEKGHGEKRQAKHIKI